ncbi:MAG: DUF4834 family protein [Rikenellaceae bacterium]
MLNWIKDNPIFFLLIFLAIVSPSFFFGAMQVVFYIIFGIVVLMLILGLIFRAKIRAMQKEMEERGAQGGFYSSFQQRGSRSSNTRSDEGDVNIFQQGGAGEKKVSENVGDYVDFEEVKEKK